MLAFENCGIYPLNRSKISVLNTEISLTHTNTPLPKYMRSSSLISVVPQTPGSSLPDLSSPDVCTPKNRLDSIMKQFESTSSEIANLFIMTINENISNLVHKGLEWTAPCILRAIKDQQHEEELIEYLSKLLNKITKTGYLI